MIKSRKEHSGKQGTERKIQEITTEEIHRTERAIEEKEKSIFRKIVI